MMIYMYCISSLTDDPAGFVARSVLHCTGSGAKFPKLPETFAKHLHGSDMARVQSQVGKCELLAKNVELDHVYFTDYNYIIETSK